MRRMKKVIVMLAIGIVFLLLAQNKVQARDIEQLVSTMAKNINETVPQTIDMPDGTRMTLLFASAQGNRLTYHYRIHNLTAEETSKTRFRQVMRPIIMSQVCPTPLIKILNEGIVLAYSYLDAYEQYLATIIIHPGDC